ncbi:xylose isomerase [Fibrobacterota bacterium]
MTEFFPDIKKIPYEGPATRNPLAFRHYDPDEVVFGKPLSDHLRFSMHFGRTFRGAGRDVSGPAAIARPWEEPGDSLKDGENRLRAAFEFMKKMGIRHYSFHDLDLCPENDSPAKAAENINRMVKIAKELQEESGINLLWGSADLGSHPHYLNGACTSPDARVFAFAAAQVKRAMDITCELGGENYLFGAGREGYQTLLNTDLRRELDHMANFLKMAADYRQELGFPGTLLIEPKPKGPCKHLYNFDVATVMGFLTHYGLNQEYKLNIECNHAILAGHDFEHDLDLAARYGMLGSIDANAGDPLLGWDTDQFNVSLRRAAQAMWIVLDNGGLESGGLNFDAGVRSESPDLEDMFIAHISSMDVYARGLKTAARIIEEGIFSDFQNRRYSSYDTDIGAKIEAGTTNFSELSEWILKEGEPGQVSGKQEKLESLLNYYLEN